MIITRGCATARDAWKQLHDVFVNANLTSHMALEAELTNYTHKQGTSVEDHIKAMQEIADRIAISGEPWAEPRIVAVVLRSMPEEYKSVVKILQHCSNPADRTLVRVTESLKAEEANLAAEKTKLATLAYFTQKAKPPPKGTTTRCEHCNKMGHSKTQCFELVGYPDWWANRPRASRVQGQKRPVETSQSGRTEQPAARRRSRKDDDDDDNRESNSATMTSRPAIAFVTTVDLEPSRIGPTSLLSTHRTNSSEQFDPSQSADSERVEESKWVLDSGCTQHICYQRRLLKEFRETAPVTIIMGNDATTVATGVGSAILWFSLDGESYVQEAHIKDVLYVPDFSVNLLSVHKLTVAGYGCTLVGNTATVTLSDMTPYCTAYRSDFDHLYRLVAKGRPSTGEQLHSSQLGPNPGTGSVALVAVSRSEGARALRDVSPSRLWHDRLGHLNAQQMMQLRGVQLAEGASELPSGITTDSLACESCIVGKARRAPMPHAATHRATRCLELVHSDICGPMRIPSIMDGNIYLISFIDDFSRFMTILAIRRKDQALESFRTYKASAELATGQHIAVLRTDGGGEYVSGVFHAFLRQCGIQRQTTPPHTPEHNGVSERAWLTIFNMVRSMLHRACLPHSFWQLAAFAAVYVRNRCPSRAVDTKIPYELWTGLTSDISHLRVFGCLAYGHVADVAKQGGKLADRAVPCIHVGWSAVSKAYLLFDPSKTGKHRLVTSRDVTFMEHRLVDVDGILASLRIGEGESVHDLFPDASDDDDSVQQPSPRLGIVESDAKAAEMDIFNLEVAESDLLLSEDADDFLDTLPLNVLFPSELAPFAPRVGDREHGNHSAQVHALSSLVLDSDEPSSFSEAMSRPDSTLWWEAGQSEYDSIQRAGTWTLTELPDGRHLIGCKWVFKIKRNADGSVNRYKMRLVAKGFTQQEGIDYKETFAPVAKFASIRTLLALAAWYDLEVHQMDVKTAFLNGDLDVDLYMAQPEGFVVRGKEHLVCKLRKALYGLKQAGRAWFEKINAAFMDLGFSSLDTDYCIYRKISASTLIFVALYVDDILLISNALDALQQLKDDLSKRFEMTDLGEAQFVLGLQVSRDRAARTLTLSQADYVRRVVERFGATDWKPQPTPLATGPHLSKSDCPVTVPAQPELLGGTHAYASIVGAIMYAMLGTRPDLAYSIGQLTRFNSNPGPTHWKALKRVLRYLKGSVDFQLVYGAAPGYMSSASSGISGSTVPVVGYCDADWAASVDDRHSITGTLFLVAGGAVSWQAQRQKSVALSSVEAEYMAACQAAKEAVWLRALLMGLGLSNSTPTIIKSDSQGSIALAKNPEHHQRSKHIDLRYHYTREQVIDGVIEFLWTPTSEMVADQLTKPLTKEQHNRCMLGMGLRW